MIKTFDEERLRFTFDEQWQVEKYDDHPDYRQKIGRLPETKAIDFLGVLKVSDGIVYFIEVKDFRGYRIQNKRRMSDGELAVEVAQKVRDTIAGFVGAFRTSSNVETWKKFVQTVYRSSVPVHVVVWLEEDLPQTPRERRAVRANVLVKQLKEQLSWLTTKVMVASMARDSRIPGLAVSALPAK